MKRWPLIIAALYTALLLVLTVPGVLLAFAPGVRPGEAVKVFGVWPYWLWLALMFASQGALLAVPARVASRRPVTQGPIWRTILAGGVAAGCLVAGAFASIYEFFFRDAGNWQGWVALAVGLLSWGIWALVFSRLSRGAEPMDLVSRQCRTLIKGSIIELLIAVPTHIVARYRDYCCAGFMTFFGLTMGVSVMLFAFGPSVLLLYVARWRKVHPQQNVGRSWSKP